MKDIKIYHKNYTLKGSYYSSNTPSDSVLIYFHGGGLIFGERNDLPIEYIEVITQYFNLLTVDYRLLPEASFDDILEDLRHIYEYTKNNFQKLYCMGRSAGGFLSLIFANKYQVEGVINFYGFYNTSHPTFKSVPSNHIHITHLLTDDLKHQLIKNQISTSESPNPRYLLYLYYRHYGLWPTLINYNMTKNELNHLPKMFIAHAVNDPDVPIYYSNDLSNVNDSVKFVKIESDKHDFDKDVTHDTVNLYHNACQYIRN